FRWRAGRGEVVCRKDIPQDADGVVAWRRRLRDVHGDSDANGATSWRPSLASHGAEGLRALGRRYGARYAILPSRPALDLPRVGPDGLFYVIYRLDASDAEP